MHEHALAFAAPRARASRREQPRFGLGVLRLTHLEGRFRLVHERRRGLRAALRCIALVLRHGFPLGKCLDAPILERRKVAFGHGALQLRARVIPGSGGRIAPGARHSDAARIEKFRIVRLDSCDHGFLRLDGIADLELDPPHEPRDGSRDDEYVAYAGLALVADADGQRPAFYRHDVDGYGLRPEQPSEHEQQDKQERRPECQAATERCVHRLIPAS